MNTSVTLPPPLLESVAAAAARDGTTVEAWIAVRLRGALAQPPPLPPRPPLPPGEVDPLYADTSTFSGEGPTDVAERHDYYLDGLTTHDTAACSEPPAL